MQTVMYEVKGMTCGSCETSVRNAVGLVPGVTGVTASHPTQRVGVDFASDPDEDAVRAAVEDAGFEFVARR